MRLLFLFFCFFLLNNCHAFDKNILSFQTDTAVLENLYVVVNKNRFVFSSGNADEVGPRIILALSKLIIESSKGKIKLRRGEVSVFSENNFYKSIDGEYFEVGIKKNHPKPKRPDIWHEPTKNRVVYENTDFRIFEERLNAGEDRALHSHIQRLVIRLNNVHLTDPRFYPTGQEGVGIQVPNTVKFAEPVEHVVRNLSKIPLFNVVIEFNAVD